MPLRRGLVRTVCRCTYVLSAKRRPPWESSAERVECWERVQGIGDLCRIPEHIVWQSYDYSRGGFPRVQSLSEASAPPVRVLDWRNYLGADRAPCAQAIDGGLKSVGKT